MAAALVWGALLPVQAQSRLCVSVAPEYSHNNFRWAIAGNSQGTHPDMYSELIWKNVQRIGMGVSADWYFSKHFVAGIHLTKNYTIAGKVTDTDYNADNRTEPVYHGVFKSNKGGSALLAGSAGYILEIGKNAALTFSSGYTWQQQTLFLLPADQFTPADLRSTYRTTWHGYTVSVSLKTNLAKKIFMEPAISYYQLTYAATANWNLIPAFSHPLSFTHNANGYGIMPVWKMGYGNAYIKIQYNYQTTGKGTEHLYLSTGDVRVTQLNSATQKTLQLSIGFTARWKRVGGI